MNSPVWGSTSRGGAEPAHPAVTLSPCGPKQRLFLHKAQGSDDSTMLHKQNLGEDILAGMRGGGTGSPATARSNHLGVGHINTGSKSMDGLNSNYTSGLSADYPAFARTKQYRSMSNDDVKMDTMPSKQMPGEPRNYMEAAAAAMQTGKGSSIIDNLMKEYQRGNLYARQPADLLLPNVKQDPSQPTTQQQQNDLVLHRENSAPQLSGMRERRMMSPPDYPGQSRFSPNMDLTPTGTPRSLSPQSAVSDVDFPTSRSSRSLFSSRDSSASVFSDFDAGLSLKSRRRHSPLSTSSLMSDFDLGGTGPPPDYPGFKRTPWQSHSGREFRSRKESATVDHSRASSFGSYQHSLNLKRVSSETSYGSSKGSSTSSTSPLSTDAPGPHPSPASQAGPHPSPASQAGPYPSPASQAGPHLSPVHLSPSSQPSQPSFEPGFELDHEAIASRATHMVEMLSDENNALRNELETYYQKVAMLQKFEHEIHKVQTEHERLIESTQKREHLEKLVRTKLEVEVKKLQEKQRIRVLASESQSRVSAKSGKEEDSSEGDDAQAEASQKDNLIFQLRRKCRDLDDNNVQLVADLQEQRQHVDMLDAALSKAQADVAKLQEECVRRQVYVDKVTSLQRLVTSLQAAHLKREKLENRFRHKLEREIEKLKGNESAANQDEGVSELEDSSQGTLASLLSERENTILKLEAEASKWEHKYLEECAIRQCHVEEQPNTRLEALSSLEGRRGQSQSDDDIRHKARIHDLEARLSSLSIEVQKRELIIQALQNQLLDRGPYGGLSPASSSLERISYPGPGPGPGPGPQPAYHSLRRGSGDSTTHSNPAGPSPAGSSNSLHNAPRGSPASSVQNLHSQGQQSPTSSTYSLQGHAGGHQGHHSAKSPASSTNNLLVSPLSSTHNLVSPMSSTHNLVSPMSSSHNLCMVSRSPASSQQNLAHQASLFLGSRSPASGSQHSLGLAPRPPSYGSIGSGLGSQERLAGLSDSYTSLSTSGHSMTGTDGGSDADLARERTFLDERLKQLDIEIAQQDRILTSIWKS